MAYSLPSHSKINGMKAGACPGPRCCSKLQGIYPARLKNVARYINIGFLSLFLSIVFPFHLSAHKTGNENNHSPGPDYQIGRWRGFKKAAVTLSFDDNYRFQVTYATPLLNQHNYKATFFIVTNRVGKGWAPGWDTLNILASEGHEIASHSKNHPDFVELSMYPEWADSMIHEFRDSRDIINSRIPLQKCETFAWPNGEVNATTIEIGRKFYLAIRGSDNGFNGQEPLDYYNISSQHIYHDTPLQAVNGFTDSIMALGGWLVERWHGFRVGNDTNGYEPVPIEEFASHLDHMALNEDVLWITTLDTVFRYIKERETSVLAMVDSTQTLISYSLTNPLPDSMFHSQVPISLKLRLGLDLTRVRSITQGNKKLPYYLSSENGLNYLNFDAIPNINHIVLHMPNPAGDPGLIASDERALNYPNPFTSATTLLFNLPEARQALIIVYDQFGRQLKNYSNFYPAGKNSIEIRGDGMLPGVYKCVISYSGSNVDISLVVAP